jgi:hypothetical protein
LNAWIYYISRDDWRWVALEKYVVPFNSFEKGMAYDAFGSTFVFISDSTLWLFFGKSSQKRFEIFAKIVFVR